MAGPKKIPKVNITRGALKPYKQLSKLRQNINLKKLRLPNIPPESPKIVEKQIFRGLNYRHNIINEEGVPLRKLKKEAKTLTNYKSGRSIGQKLDIKSSYISKPVKFALGRAAGPLGTLASFAAVAKKAFNIYTKTKKAKKTYGPALKQLKKDYKYTDRVQKNFIKKDTPLKVDGYKVPLLKSKKVDVSDLKFKNNDPFGSPEKNLKGLIDFRKSLGVKANKSFKLPKRKVEKYKPFKVIKQQHLWRKKSEGTPYTPRDELKVTRDYKKLIKNLKRKGNK